MAHYQSSPAFLAAVFAVSALASPLSLAAGEPVAVEPNAQPSAWVQKLISEFATSSTSRPPSAIWKVQYNGTEAYLFIEHCCDQFNYLYSAEGVLICAPTGGFAGAGDGKCPDALDLKQPISIVWPRSQARIQ